MDSPFGIYLFQYLGMGLIFVLGLIYAVRQKDVGIKRGRRRQNLVLLVGGLALYMALHGFFQFVAVRF